MIKRLLSCGACTSASCAMDAARVVRVVLDAFDLEVSCGAWAAAVLAEEGEVHAAGHVGRGHERADQTDDQEQLVVVVARR